MYPLIRVGLAMRRARRAPRLAPGEVHVERTRCWPWDVDPFMELNNGRTMTLMDMGRIPVFIRSGLLDVLEREGWRLTMAGASIVYRRRVPTFAPLEIRTRPMGRDARFLYVEHLTSAKGEPAHHAVYRAAVVERGIVPTDRVIAAAGETVWDAALPDWAADWAAAESKRPWPPEFQGFHRNG